MKRTMAAIALLATSLSGFAGANFNSATGYLVIPDVTIDGKTFYDSATLQLDMSNGTFKIVSATPKNTKVSDTPLQTFSSSGITIDFLGCYRSGTNQISCQTSVTNNNNDASMDLVADSRAYYSSSLSATVWTKLFDDLGASYSGSISAFHQESTGYLRDTILQGVPVKVTYTFPNVDSHARFIPAFSPVYYFRPTQSVFQATFKNITF